MSNDDGDDELPEAVLEAEREGPERPLISGNVLGKAGLALLAAVFLGLVILAVVLFLRRAKFPWLA